MELSSMHVLTVSIIIFCWIVWIAHWNDTNSHVKHRYETKIIQKKNNLIESDCERNSHQLPRLSIFDKNIQILAFSLCLRFSNVICFGTMIFFTLQLAYLISLHQMIDAIHENNSKANLIDLKAISFWRNDRILDWWLDTICKLKGKLLGLCIWHFIIWISFE